jgi:hypothetical protein
MNSADGYVCMWERACGIPTPDESMQLLDALGGATAFSHRAAYERTLLIT